MTCAHCRPLLSKYVDGEALPAERLDVEAHIGGCPQCSALLAQYGVLRSRVHNLPHYQPDPRGRARLLAALDRLPRTADEVPITRRQGIVPPRRVAPARAGWWLFGNLATGFAMLIVLAAVAVITQVINGGIGIATASPTWVAVNGRQIIVPTKIATIAVAQSVSAQPTTVARISGASKTLSASPTATFWADDADVGPHLVRDDAYGYQFQYPSGWWTAAAAPVAGALAQRVLRPQPRRDGSLPAANMTVDVLSNTAQLRAVDAAHLDSPALRAALTAWQDDGATPAALTGIAAGISGFSTVSTGSKGRRRSDYLLGGSLVYRVTMQEPLQSTQADKDAGEAARNMVLQSFQSAATPAASLLGATPLLFLHNGDLWAIEQPDHAPVRWTTDGRVRAFALSPAGDRVALLLGNDAGDLSARSIKLLTVTDKVLGAQIWRSTVLYTMVWLNDRRLLAIGGTPGATGAAVGSNTPLGLYQLAIDTSGVRQQLLDWAGKGIPEPISSARNLRVSPDGGWISFQAGANLYALEPDRKSVHSLLPRINHPPAVQDYAWLPPGADGAAMQLLLLTDGGLRALHIGLPGGESEMSDLIHPNAGALTQLAVAPNGHAAGLSGAPDSATLCLTKAPGTPTAGQVFVLPGATDLRWCPTAACLLYAQGSGVVTHLRAMDLAGRVILDQPMEPAP